MFNSSQLVTATMHAHSWECLSLGPHHLWADRAIEQALTRGRRLRAEAMVRGDWRRASQLEEHLVVAEDRLAQHRHQLDALAASACGLRSRVRSPAA
jgi:hypothetical protein